MLVLLCWYYCLWVCTCVCSDGGASWNTTTNCYITPRPNTTPARQPHAIHCEYLRHCRQWQSYDHCIDCRQQQPQTAYNCDPAWRARPRSTHAAVPAFMRHIHSADVPLSVRGHCNGPRIPQHHHHSRTAASGAMQGHPHRRRVRPPPRKAKKHLPHRPDTGTHVHHSDKHTMYTMYRSPTPSSAPWSAACRSPTSRPSATTTCARRTSTTGSTSPRAAGTDPPWSCRLPRSWRRGSPPPVPTQGRGALPSRRSRWATSSRDRSAP